MNKNIRVYDSRRLVVTGGLALLLLLGACGESDGGDDGAARGEAKPLGYAQPAPLTDKAKAPCSDLPDRGDKPRIAYVPPSSVFNYYLAIGEGIKARAAEHGASTFMLAPPKDDVSAQLGMIQDVLTQDVDAIIMNTHDQNAAAPLVQRAVQQGIAVTIVNSDIPDFPSPVHAVVGYRQFPGDAKLGAYAVKLAAGKPIDLGILEGAPGYFSDQRVGGFLSAIKGKSNFKVVARLNGEWTVDGGNKAATDMLQAHPEVDMIFAANDYEILGAAKSAQALGKNGLMLFGSDGDTNAGLEQVASGAITATLDTTPFEMGRIALQVTMDCLDGKFSGGQFVETPTRVVDKDSVQALLCKPDSLYPKPSKTYSC
jgi:ribose transport system substrate-binding protein